MKHIRLILAALLLMTVSLSSLADTTDAEAQNYKTSIMSYLREEGYAPKIDPDGDIQFKYQGESYYITVGPYDNGFYVTYLSMSDLEGLDVSQVLVALDRTEKSLKFVRCYTTEDYKFAIMQICLYCETIGDFRRMYSNSMDIITTADERFINNMVDLIGED